MQPHHVFSEQALCICFYFVICVVGQHEDKKFDILKAADFTIKPSSFRAEHKDQLHEHQSKKVTFRAFKTNIVLDLAPLLKIIHPNAVANLVDENGKKTQVRIQREKMYTGIANNDPRQRVDAVEVSGVWIIYIRSPHSRLTVKPLHLLEPEVNRSWMVVYKDAFRWHAWNAYYSNMKFPDTSQSVDKTTTPCLETNNCTPRAINKISKERRSVDNKCHKATLHNTFNSRIKRSKEKSLELQVDSKPHSNESNHQRTETKQTQGIIERDNLINTAFPANRLPRSTDTQNMLDKTKVNTIQEKIRSTRNNLLLESFNNTSTSKPTECDLLAIVDFNFYKELGSDPNMAIAVLALSYTFTDEILRRTKFPGHPPCGIIIREFQIHTAYIKETYHYNTEPTESIKALTVLENMRNSTGSTHFYKFCLVHLNCKRNFQPGVAGMAYWGEPFVDHWTAGICGVYFETDTSYTPTNVLFTRLGYNDGIDVLSYALVVTHEIGHAWGSHHDGHSDQCKDTRRQHIMSKYVLAGDMLDEAQFSTCSLKAISKLLTIRREMCFTRRECGNGQLDEGEECDPGTDSLFDHPCCTVHCILKPGAECSFPEDVCCSNRCASLGVGPECRQNASCPDGKCESTPPTDYNRPRVSTTPPTTILRSEKDSNDLYLGKVKAPVGTENRPTHRSTGHGNRGSDCRSSWQFVLLLLSVFAAPNLVYN